MADMETARRMSDERKIQQQKDQQQQPPQQHLSSITPLATAAGSPAIGLPQLMQSLLNLQDSQQQLLRPQQQSQAQQQHANNHHHQEQQQPGRPANSSGQIIRLRGLPFSATEADVQAFLAPIDLPEGLASVQLARHPDLRPTGEAYVHLRSEAELLLALKKHKSMMGKRYIEASSSSCTCTMGF